MRKARGVVVTLIVVIRPVRPLLTMVRRTDSASYVCTTVSSAAEVQREQEYVGRTLVRLIVSLFVVVGTGVVLLQIAMKR